MCWDPAVCLSQPKRNAINSSSLLVLHVLAGREAYPKRSTNPELGRQLLHAGIFHEEARNDEWELGLWMGAVGGGQKAGELRPLDHLSIGWKASWRWLTLPFSAPTRSIQLTPPLALPFLAVQGMFSDTCLDFSICPQPFCPGGIVRSWGSWSKEEVGALEYEADLCKVILMGRRQEDPVLVPNEGAFLHPA